MSETFGLPAHEMLEVTSYIYLPFGEQVAGSTTTHKFTGYERDSETGLDNAQARYNSSAMGRFMSPDPVGNFVADATNPQTWNMYAYVNNNPLAFIDPTGFEGKRPLPQPPSIDPFDCIPLIFERSNPFDAEFPDPTSLFNLQSTFCGAGGDFARHIADGGGRGGGRPSGGGVCPLNGAGISTCIAAPPPQAPTSQQKYDRCMANFNNSTGGKVANFFSVLHMADSLETLAEWIAGPTVKVWVVRTVSQGGVQSYGLLSGSAPLSTAGKIAEGSGVAGTAAVVVGTLADTTARASCQTEAHPELLGGWMYAPF